MATTEDKLRMLGRKLHGKHGWPVLSKGEPEWEMWRSWRIRHGLSVGFWGSLGRVTVPTELPPTDLDEALKQAGAGQLSERLAG